VKPRVFIGSSTEALPIAYAIQENLEHDALCTVWTQGIFELSQSALDNLLKATGQCDFAVFVFQPDDILQMRDHRVWTVRDNVVFELGLFIGKLGKQKVFFLVPKNSEEIHLPTDLVGIQPGHYDPPDNKESLLAALGPFCNNLRRRIQSVWMTNGEVEAESEEVDLILDPSTSKSKKVEKDQPEQIKQLKNVEYGVQADAFGNFTISIAPTVFFHYRVCSSFPGIRGIHRFVNGKEGLDRLGLLLKEPLRFEKATGHGSTTDPIWVWRGGSHFPISKFRRLNDTHCLVDVDELNISKIAVWRSGAYYKDFVYVEVHPDQPTGLYPTDKASIQSSIDMLGYALEEYGLFQDTPITRACYDDGAAVIDGAVIDTSGAQLRIRYLSPFNFLIASKFSPINSHEFDELSEPLLNDMLCGQDHLDELCSIINRLPRHDHED
jgi:Predicted nucleotide-binding protein containing TIR-like domain